MTDIVDRLRKENSCPPYYGVPKIQADAADEIERLRAALEEIVKPGGADDFWQCVDIARAALEGKQ